MTPPLEEEKARFDPNWVADVVSRTRLRMKTRASGSMRACNEDELLEEYPGIGGSASISSARERRREKARLRREFNVGDCKK